MGGYDGILPFFTADLHWSYPTPATLGSLIPQPGQQFPPYELNLSFGNGVGTGNNFPTGFPDVLTFWLLPSTVGGLSMSIDAREWDAPPFSVYTQCELDLYIKSFTITGSPSPAASFSLTKNEATIGTPIALTTNLTNARRFVQFATTFNETGIPERVGVKCTLNTDVASGTLEMQARARLTQSPNILPDVNIGPAIGRPSHRQWFVINIEQAIPVGAGNVKLDLYVNGFFKSTLGTYNNASGAGVQPIVNSLADIGGSDRWTILVTASNPGVDVSFGICTMFFPD
jgi:hypothetical protein